MLTHKDIEFRTIFVINCTNSRTLRVCNGELLLEDNAENRTLTKMPFQKILALFVVGSISITTPLLENCRKFNVAIVVVKQTFRPVFFWAAGSDGNFNLRRRQHTFPDGDISIAKVIVRNKIANQLALLKKTRMNDNLVNYAKQQCEKAMSDIQSISDYKQLLGTEGYVARSFFAAYFQQVGWKSRMPRVKPDALNATLDLGYTILFNFVECFASIFGFDLYVGIYHRRWFMRKSLICDLMEPFRCIIDRETRTAFRKRRCSESDFVVRGGRYQLKYENIGKYCNMFFEAIVAYKTKIFGYMQEYYRCFSKGRDVELYPLFQI